MKAKFTWVEGEDTDAPGFWNCYVEFVDSPAGPTGMEYLSVYPSVVAGTNYTAEVGTCGMYGHAVDGENVVSLEVAFYAAQQLFKDYFYPGIDEMVTVVEMAP